MDEPTTQVDQNLHQVLWSLGIDKDRWDHVLFGDGSGNTWEKPCGWACTMVSRISRHRRVFYGSMSHGTNVTAELMAYLHPLFWLAEQPVNSHRGTNVHIVTDCRPLVTMWKSQHRKTNKLIWSAMSQIQKLGLRLEFHWIPRDTYQLNQFADALSRYSRLHLQAGDEPIRAQSLEDVGQAASVFKLNPTTA